VTWYADLSRCTLFPWCERVEVLAVGWLERGHDFAIGDVPDGLVPAISRLIRNVVPECSSMGFHWCDLCVERGAIGSTEVYVADGGVAYVAPGMVMHYIAEHRYRPPAVFVEAVFACAALPVDAYIARMAERGVLVFDIDAIKRGEMPPKPPDR
jgi:hypothetical protein